MPNITPRINKNGTTSYLIRVFVDEKASGKQTVKSMTYKPELGMTERQIEKKLNETAVMFEQKVKSGIVAYDGRVKFEDYAARWMEVAQIAPKTREGYELYLRRINEAIGHIRLDKLQAHHLEAFYKNLTEENISTRGRYAIAGGLDRIMDERSLSRSKLAIAAGVSPAVMGLARRGNRVSIETAAKIADALGVPASQVFDVQDKTGGLSDKTISHHHRLISAILSKAKKERIIPFNVALEHANAPKVAKKEAKFLDDEEARRLVELLLQEDDIRVKTAILLSLYSGVRRGELCGLSWGDVDENKGIIHILRASQYLNRIGVVEVPTKNESSKRPIKLPPFIFQTLREYKKWWLEQRMINGDRWKGEAERLFIKADGKPINPDTINYWFNKFIEKHGLEHFTPHSLRHTFSTLQIMAGVNIRTLQQRTGHAQASTLTNIYAHAIKTAEEAAAEVLDDILTPKPTRRSEIG
jgi:integrase